MTIATWLLNSTEILKAHEVVSAHLDAEIILAHTLKKPRTWLHAHSDEAIDSRLLEIADARIDLRKDHTPIAYIIGHKEFYGRRFTVTTNTLIPRPDSEVLIELLKQYYSRDSSDVLPRLVDVGTGSGCLGVTAKLELPDFQVTVLDTSHSALQVAARNASKLNAEVAVQRSDLLSSYPYSADVIVANLPYVDESWVRNLETDHEPAVALFASDDGLHLIKRLLIQAAALQTAGQLLILEADPRQHAAIITCADGYSLIEARGYGLGLKRL